MAFSKLDVEKIARRINDWLVREGATPEGVKEVARHLMGPPVAWRMVTPVVGNVVFLEEQAEADRFASMDDREITPLYS